MALLMLALWGCVPDSPTGLEPTGSTLGGDCDAWPVAVGDAPLFGGNAADTTVDGAPGTWPLDLIRRLEVHDGYVQRLGLDGVPLWGDFAVDGGLYLESFYSDDGAFDVVYDAPLELYRYPVEGSWSSTASFADATVGYVINEGVDTFEVVVVDTVDLELDGIVFTDVAVLETMLTRELAVSSGPVMQTETVWLAPCYGVIARNAAGLAMRLLP